MIKTNFYFWVLFHNNNKIQNFQCQCVWKTSYLRIKRTFEKDSFQTLIIKIPFNRYEFN